MISTHATCHICKRRRESRRSTRSLVTGKTEDRCGDCNYRRAAEMVAAKAMDQGDLERLKKSTRRGQQSSGATKRLTEAMRTK